MLEPEGRRFPLRHAPCGGRTDMIKLYSYWRSTTSIRVRCVLNLKKFDYQIVPVNLLESAQTSDKFAALNPAMGVPVLVLSDGTVLTQSLAIIDYLDAIRPEPPLLQEDAVMRAKELSAAYCIAMEIHPVNNLRVLNYLRGTFGQCEDEISAYVLHWMHSGLMAFQKTIRTDTPFAFGDRLGLADICLVSQMFSARRWGLDLQPFGRLCEIDALMREHPAIAAAMPENQPDARTKSEHSAPRERVNL